MGWGAWGLCLVLGALFFVYAWPGLWVFSGNGEGMVRVNRFTGVVEHASQFGWRTEAQLAVDVQAATVSALVDYVQEAFQRGEVESFTSDGLAVTIYWKSGNTETHADPLGKATRALEMAGVKRVYR